MSVLNKYVRVDHVKFEDYRVAKELLIENGFMFKFDLSSGYHHLSVNPLHHPYLGFSWFLNGKLSYFVFSVLPFGLRSAPYIFTKLLRPLFTFWRSQGLRIVVFLDDGWGINKDFQSSLRDAEFVKQTLVKAGFVINLQKSIFLPVQILEWLGYLWDLKEGYFKIPERRILNTSVCLQNLLNSLPVLSARKLAQLAGKIISMAPVLGNICLLKTKVVFFFDVSNPDFLGIQKLISS